MKKTRIVDLGSVKDLLAEWEKVRISILQGRITGFQTTLMDEDQTETVFFGGVYKEDPKLALSAILKTSAAKTIAHDVPPRFKVGSS